VEPRKQNASLAIPENTGSGETFRVICVATENGNPPLTRYRRGIVEVQAFRKSLSKRKGEDE